MRPPARGASSSDRFWSDSSAIGEERRSQALCCCTSKLTPAAFDLSEDSNNKPAEERVRQCSLSVRIHKQCGRSCSSQHCACTTNRCVHPAAGWSFFHRPQRKRVWSNGRSANGRIQHPAFSSVGLCKVALMITSWHFCACLVRKGFHILEMQVFAERGDKSGNQIDY